MKKVILPNIQLFVFVIFILCPSFLFAQQSCNPIPAPVKKNFSTFQTKLNSCSDRRSTHLDHLSGGHANPLKQFLLLKHPSPIDWDQIGLFPFFVFLRSWIDIHWQNCYLLLLRSLGSFFQACGYNSGDQTLLSSLRGERMRPIEKRIVCRTNQ